MVNRGDWRTLGSLGEGRTRHDPRSAATRLASGAVLAGGSMIGVVFEKKQPPYALSFNKKSMSKNVCYQVPPSNSTDEGFLKICNFTLFTTQKLSYGSGKMKL
ncbi:hypothetical protein RF11_13694 [Thelohanellus kitauei]|uniref:Uncharacterized protein n=1 Tax=Thelohanellus kitauei TaxID=669202 RepID=A0A0C2JNC8_THEKT|nr:hypothetical protein RF11_13694 [Thelohanellus kitauei]